MAKQKILSSTEFSRLRGMSSYESRLKVRGFSRIAGIDEAGRGPLAGPVFAAACILHDFAMFEHLNDSKQLSALRREALYAEIIGHPLVCFGIGKSDEAEIDRLNILQATFLAMQRAVAALPEPPDYLLVDGNRLPAFSIPAETIVLGDCLSVSIAASSILAKVSRDRVMEELDKKWPQYGFQKHKGYPTEEHLAALRKYGPCPSHRKTFAPVKALQHRHVQMDFSFSVNGGAAPLQNDHCLE